MVLSEEDVADLLADLGRAQRGKEAAVVEKEAKKRKYEAELEWLQTENVEMPMFSLLEGPQ